MPTKIIKVGNSDKENIDRLNSYGKKVLFGIPKEQNIRKTDSAQSNTINNANIMAIMEAGSVVNNIPARPLFDKVVQKHKEQIDDYFQQIFDALLFDNKEEADMLMEALALDMQAWCQSYFTEDNGWKPNAPITIHGGWMHRNGKSFYVKGKKSDKPIINTGELRKSIRGIVVKER